MITCSSTYSLTNYVLGVINITEKQETIRKNAEVNLPSQDLVHEASAYNQLGLLYSKLGDDEKALEAFEKGV